MQAEDVDSSLLPPADQLLTGGLHQNDVFHRVLPVPDTVQDQVDFVHHVAHDEVANRREGLGPCRQVVGCRGGHCPHADQHRGGHAPDVLADVIKIWQLQPPQEVLTQHDAAVEKPDECVFLRKVSRSVDVGGVENCVRANERGLAVFGVLEVRV
ncbi:hypothetical protein EYF80_023762 [Liparis tanakae]|uniref:Uncharacterized protein n=1 Tax=Liparis tanakae TaxID=230148 RepID=A0A4Z2HJR3_9TELE|nr:hypothetical protein EYF80_023762 [Liparis tanakae]